ncbi:MAG: pyrimidine 5'-nucleotidase [Zoogloea sp.]|nr:pyrimidine 5'-nucleotidase [Zoogloea sp.]
MSRPTWLFDLDDTLHHATAHIFPHINRSMTAYVMQHLSVSEQEANALRVTYWKRYGATLLGLMRHHGTDPTHFLHATHQFPDLRRMVVFERALGGLLRRLPGRKIVFSNAPRQYAEAVLEVMGVRRCFNDVFAIEQMRLKPKPGLAAFRHLINDHRLDPQRCIMVEDSAENLLTAKRLGMRTVWISRSLKRPQWVDLQLRSILELARKHPRL